MNSTYQERKYPEKSWSISKMKTLENCERDYYYTYYGSHNGWIYSSTDEQKMAWRLKKLTNLCILSRIIFLILFKAISLSLVAFINFVLSFLHTFIIPLISS